MNRYAAFALSIASMFFLIMAILVNSPALFYMVTAVMATLLASLVQAWLAVRALRFERYAPPAVQVGEPVTVEITAWSERRIMRPLITVIDLLPRALVSKGLKPSLPIAPSFEQPIQTRYTFRPMRRGRFKWSNLRVKGTDALGLIVRERTYKTDPVELTVYPAPIPVQVEITPTAGWGASDLDSGRKRGSGLEPRSIREYSPGDPIRYIHWKSSAKSSQLMVKEFDTGSGVSVAMVIQRTRGTEVGRESASTLEAMCGHALYLAEQYVNAGASVEFPLQEGEGAYSVHPDARIRAIREVLTDLHADHIETISQDLLSLRGVVTPGTTLLIFVASQDDRLPEAIQSLPGVQKVCLVYDTEDYRTLGGKRTETARAADPVYLARLEASGAEVHVMPKVENLG